MGNFPKGDRKPKIVGKTTSSRKLGGAELTSEVDFRGNAHFAPFNYIYRNGGGLTTSNKA